MHLKSFFLYLGAVLLLLGAIPLAAQDEPTESDRLTLLEFRSLLSVGGEMSFSLYDPFLDETFWLTPGQTRQGYEIVTYSPEDNILVVALGEFERELSLAQSRIATAEMPAETEESGSSASSSASRDSSRSEGSGRERSENRPSREEIQRLQSVLVSALESSSGLQEISEAYREAMRDGRRLGMMMRNLEEGDPAREEAQRLSRELHDEFRSLNQAAQAEINAIGGINEADRQALADNFTRVLWSQTRSERRQERQEQSLTNPLPVPE